ncbi:MAG: hypothetical protein IPF54_28110 [Draconibacterium sp.]|nr:hypothetical protein [Draconibacterium sp.]
MDDIAGKLTPVKDKPLTFTASLNLVNKANIELEPFYRIHDSRYMIYHLDKANRIGSMGVHIDSLAVRKKKGWNFRNEPLIRSYPANSNLEADHPMEK